MDPRRLKWLPVIAPAKCTGCGLCVAACGPKCLAVVDGLAVLTSADACGSEEHCISACRDDAIHMRWVPSEGSRDRGRWA